MKFMPFRPRGLSMVVCFELMLIAGPGHLFAQEPMPACAALKTAFTVEVKAQEPFSPEPSVNGEAPDDRAAREARNRAGQEAFERRERVLLKRKTLLRELTEPSGIPVVDCRIERGCIRVDWGIVQEQQLQEALGLFRFSEKTPLKIYTSNFNFLHYTVKWTAAAEPQNPAFERVSSLFDSVFPLLGILGGGGARGFEVQTETTLSRWVVPLEQANNCLAEALGQVSGVVLDQAGDANKTALHKARHYIAQALPLLSLRRAEYLEDLGPDDFELYYKVAERHTGFEKRAAEFLPLAQRTVEGMMTTIDAQPRNSVVTLSGQASTRAGEPAGGAVTAKYFVATSRPLTYHVGYAYGRIRDFGFKQVRSAQGQDVFTVVAGSNATSATTEDHSSGVNPIAFLTWEFANAGPNRRYGVGLTLGTALNAPQSSLYLGGSVRMFTRVFASAGAVAGRGLRGVGQTTDTAADGAKRTVFATLREVNDVKVFWSVSFKVY